MLKKTEYNQSYLDLDFAISPEVINTKSIANINGYLIGLAETSSSVQ